MECVCCCEVDAIESKIQESQNDIIQCTTDHEGFLSVCLDVWVLQTAYYNYRKKCGEAQGKSLIE